MVPLLSLPEEIIENICWQLAGDPQSIEDICSKPAGGSRSIEKTCSHPAGDPQLQNSPRPLSQFCQASRALHRIGTPVLYYCFDASQSLKKLANFLRTIILRPELAALVQELYLNTNSSTELDKSHTEAFEGAAARLGVSLDGWMERNSYEAMAQLVIAHTPNVKFLEVIAHDKWSEGGFGAFTLLEEMAAQVPRQVSLPHLRRLHVGHDHGTWISLGYFGGILELAPNVRELVTDPIYEFHCEKMPLSDRVVLDNIVHLRLKGGQISRRQLQELVSRCRALESFKYTYHYVYMSPDEKCVTPREAIEILRQHSDTLRSISLGLETRERRSGLSFYGECVDGEQILSLKDFSRLEFFHVDGSSVLFPEVQTPGYRTDILTNMLPSSIRQFELPNAQKESAANAITLATSIADFPLLEEVLLTANMADGPLGSDEVKFDELEIDMLSRILGDHGSSSGVA
ncbi:hypothetical protein V8C35DRAFT_277281 [Trichoderma chlorosporum]